MAGAALDDLPWVLRILLENGARSGGESAPATTAALVDWLKRGTSEAEIAFAPARVLMHDTTCVPALVDIAAMRSSLAAEGRDPTALNPVLGADVSVDHSVAVDHFATPDAYARNMENELRRNRERYGFMKWAARSLRGVRVHPPGTGIMHTINLERLATVVSHAAIEGETWAFPDTLIGTDSHTPMINGLGVLGWGVGGLEAESVLFGMPVMLRIPDVVGVRLVGRLGDGVLATDLALAVTERLRRLELAGRFVEFYGPGVAALSAGERAVVANMAPEYGASTGYFAIDQRTLDYLAATGRDAAHLSLVRDYARRQALWFDPTTRPRYTEELEIDLAAIAVCVAGPRRPQDRLAPGRTAEVLRAITKRERSAASPSGPPDGAVAIAAITSCTNTSDPRLLLAAGLLARKARGYGLKPPTWVKTSLAPGSPAARHHLLRAGLLADLEAIGFAIVGHGCTTCIGNSGALPEAITGAMRQHAIVPVAVLSGNRNFPGRVHPELDVGFLASPPLVIAYALAGDVDRDIQSDPIGASPDGRVVRLADLWPSGAEIDAAMMHLEPGDIARSYDHAEASVEWEAIDAAATPLYPWDDTSSYLRRPPFAALRGQEKLGRYLAHPLLVLGDDVTTDHISPAGQIAPESDAGCHLIEQGEDPHDLNVYAARRGNWEVMRRGLFTNRAVRNLLAPDLPAGTTIHGPSGERLAVWRAAERYLAEQRATVIVAGERYGAGSSRDWAAKGPALLGVRAILASSFERIHRTNLIGMGILPLLLPCGLRSADLGLTPDDRLEVLASENDLRACGPVPVKLHTRLGAVRSLVATAAVETALEIEILRTGGIIPLMLRRVVDG